MIYFVLYRSKSPRVLYTMFPFPTNPVVPPPDRSPIENVEKWVSEHQEYLPYFSKGDNKIYQRVRHNMNSRKGATRKRKTKEGRDRLKEIAAVS